MQLRVEYVLSDDLKNYYQEEKQPAGERNQTRSSPKFLFELKTLFIVPNVAHYYKIIEILK